ncbi:MAG: helix-turn-helix domain-containing protein [Halioglobus sp.]
MAEARPTAHDTREKLLDAAEKLFAKHGFDAVSVRAILREAGLRNQSALQYHFGDREKLISAIQGRRVTQLEQKRRELLAGALTLDRQLELRDLCGISVRAGFELCRDDPSFRNLLGLLGQRLLTSGESLLSIGPHTDSKREVYNLIMNTFGTLADMDERLLHLRMENANALGLQALSRRASSGESFRGKRAELFLSNLVDQLAAMMLAPPSAATLALL